MSEVIEIYCLNGPEIFINESFDFKYAQSWTYIAKIKHFSKENIHCRAYKAPKCIDKTYSLFLWLHANDSNEGKSYVSFAFEFPDFRLPFRISATLAVVDSYENEIFRQSFALTAEFFMKTSFHDLGVTDRYINYIPRKVLMSEPEDFLLNDCLTLKMEITHVQVTFDLLFIGEFMSLSGTPFKLKPEAGTPVPFIPEYEAGLKSEFGPEDPFFEIVVENSPVLQTQFEWQTNEGGDRGYITLTRKEYIDFRNIGVILLGCPYVRVDSLEDVCNMYTLANKYLIEPVIDACRDIIKSFLLSEDRRIQRYIKENVQELLEFAKAFRDSCLIEILDNFLESNVLCNSESKDGESIFQTKWVCRIIGDKYEFVKVIDGEEETELDFYQ